MPKRFRPFPPWMGQGVRRLACVFCFGAAGLIWSLPALRRRRRARAAGCATCKRRQALAAVLVGCLSVLLLAGVLVRAQAAATPQIVCHSHISPDGRINAEPLLQGVSPSSPWKEIRNILTAPAGGVAVLAGLAMGMESCAGPPLLVMFWEPPRTSGGGTEIGDVFVAWFPPDERATGPLSIHGYGMAGEQRYLRYGPNISQARVDEVRLALHESRHVDQWAIGTLLGGPAAFGVAYILDGALFPSSRNHFERQANLSDGGYPAVTDNWPAPRWPDTLVIALILVLMLYPRIRLASRVLFIGRNQAVAHAPQRCPIHTKGWIGQRD